MEGQMSKTDTTRSLVTDEITAHERSPIHIKRTKVELKPDPSRVLLRPFTPGDHQRIQRIITSVLSISESEVGPLLNEISSKFSPRHLHIQELFHGRFQHLRKIVSMEPKLSEQRQLLIGSYFLSEFAVESAALFNPSIVADPNQQGLPPGALRFVLSLRATGDGSISSIVFRTGIIHANHRIEVMAATGDIVEPNQDPHNIYQKALFERTCLELGLHNEHTRRVMQHLPDSFNLRELLAAVDTELDTELKKGPAPDGEKVRQETLERISMLAKSNYSVQFPPEQGLSERVIFPVTRSQRNGIEDARFVRFQNDDGTHVYYATFTAFNGQLGIPQLLETSDFLLFQLMTLNGPAVKNKGMALFPRKINGSYVMLSRQDSENVCLMFSDHVRFWYESKVLLKPLFPWELVQVGNCGSPIETKAGWLVLTHGIGPGRVYSIGACLLDLDDPSKVIGRLRDPLLKPIPREWEGNVPNVVYSCGALLHDSVLFIPYGVSDYAARFATVHLDELLAALQPEPRP
jgi:predicted GH43/DUF377 family glycosyl hydrolase